MHTYGYLEKNERGEILLKMIEEDDYAPIVLGFECRLSMWLYSTKARSMMQVYPADYFRNLSTFKTFVNSNFQQIDLDTGRLKFQLKPKMTQTDKDTLRKLTSDVLYNYTKRCATVVYIQSMSFICSFVCQIAYFGT